MPNTLTRTDTDDVFNWSEIVTTFDDNGQRTNILTTYDNGILFERAFSADGFVDPALPELGLIGEVSTRTDLPVGAGSVASWDSIVTYYAHDTPSLRLFDRQTSDNGLVKSRTFDTDGTVVHVLQEDFGDVKGWRSVEQSFGETSYDVSIRVVYDTGDIYEKTEAEYEAGLEFVFTRTELREDNSDRQDYVYEITSYLIIEESAVDPTLDDAEILLSSETLYDDGVFETFLSEDAGGNNETIKTDTLDAYDWDTITSVYEFDFQTRTTTVFDDGSTSVFFDSYLQDSYFFTNATGDEETVVSRTYFENGQLQEVSSSGTNETFLIKRYAEDGTPIEILEFDETFDVRNFEYRVVDFDAAGQIETRTTLLDNGLLRIEEFEGGVRSTTVTRDENDLFNFVGKEDIYDESGALVERLTSFDDGREQTSLFEDGVRRTTVTSDQNNLFDFVVKADIYDESGTLVERYALFDDGREQTSLFEDGVRASTVITDQGDTFDYLSRATVYDEAGDLEYKFNVFDDGRQQTIEFDQGVRTSNVMMDLNDAYDYVSRVDIYDAAGVITERQILFDDGRVQTVYFEGGQRTAIVVTDDADAFSFEQRIDLYDETGALAVRSTDFDDGSLREESFVDGQRARILTEEADGDVFVFESTENEVTRRVDFDGDMSEDWTYRVIDYTADAAPVTTIYDDENPAPTDVIDALGFVYW